MKHVHRLGRRPVLGDRCDRNLTGAKRADKRSSSIVQHAVVVGQPAALGIFLPASEDIAIDVGNWIGECCRNEREQQNGPAFHFCGESILIETVEGRQASLGRYTDSEMESSMEGTAFYSNCNARKVEDGIQSWRTTICGNMSSIKSLDPMV